MTSVLDAEAAKVAQFASDLDALEQALGHSHIEMYIRQLKMELRCARSLADDQVRSFSISVLFATKFVLVRTKGTVKLLELCIIVEFSALGRALRTCTTRSVEMARRLR